MRGRYHFMCFKEKQTVKAVVIDPNPVGSETAFSGEVLELVYGKFISVLGVDDFTTP